MREITQIHYVKKRLFMWNDIKGHVIFTFKDNDKKSELIDGISWGMESKVTYGCVSRSIFLVRYLSLSCVYHAVIGKNVEICCVCKHVATYRVCSKWNEVEVAAAI
jgi:hypothetical protein